MELISSLVKTTIPNYLSGLPIPATFGGWFKLGCKCIKIIFIVRESTFSNPLLKYMTIEGRADFAM